MADFAPRKLPKQLRSRETVDAIFRAAMDVLERQERTEPSVQTIADRAGVSIGSLYQYFPSKESLVNSLIRFHLRQNVDAIERALREVEGLTGEEAATRLVDGLVGDKRAHARVESAMLRYFLRVGDVLTLTELDAEMNRLVEKFIVSLGAQVRPVNTTIAAFVISNALRVAVLMALVQRPELLGDPQFKSELVRLVVSYLRPE